MQKADRNLREIIDERKIEKKPFSELEIYYMLKGIVDALIYLKNKNIYHFDIKP